MDARTYLTVWAYESGGERCREHSYILRTRKSLKQSFHGPCARRRVVERLLRLRNMQKSWARDQSTNEVAESAQGGEIRVVELCPQAPIVGIPRVCRESASARWPRWEDTCATATSPSSSLSSTTPDDDGAHLGGEHCSAAPVCLFFVTSATRRSLCCLLLNIPRLSPNTHFQAGVLCWPTPRAQSTSSIVHHVYNIISAGDSSSAPSTITDQDARLAELELSAARRQKRCCRNTPL